MDSFVLINLDRSHLTHSAANLISTHALDPSYMTHQQKKNSFVSTPSGEIDFGVMPQNGQGWPELPFRLKLGVIGHGRARRGAYGARHVFEKHGAELHLKCVSEVSGFVKKVISCGANVLIDKNKYPNKPLIVKSSTGMVAVTLSGCKTYYSIISAYGRKSHPGTLIGTL